MSESIFQKMAGLLGGAFAKETPCPYENLVGEGADFPPPVSTTIIRPQASGPAELIFGDVPHLPPEFRP